MNTQSSYASNNIYETGATFTHPNISNLQLITKKTIFGLIMPGIDHILFICLLAYTHTSLIKIYIS